MHDVMSANSREDSKTREPHSNGSGSRFARTVCATLSRRRRTVRTGTWRCSPVHCNPGLVFAVVAARIPSAVYT